jgi:hypothetical protein
MTDNQEFVNAKKHYQPAKKNVGKNVVRIGHDKMVVNVIVFFRRDTTRRYNNL